MAGQDAGGKVLVHTPTYIAGIYDDNMRAQHKHSVQSVTKADDA